jgi:hypothetical protein
MDQINPPNFLFSRQENSCRWSGLGLDPRTTALVLIDRCRREWSQFAPDGGSGSETSILKPNS